MAERKPARKVASKKAPVKKAARPEKKEKGNRYQFEGRNLSTDSIVRGEVVAKNEEDARQKLARRQIRVLQLNKMKSAREKKITQQDITVFTRTVYHDESRPSVDAGIRYCGERP